MRRKSWFCAVALFVTLNLFCRLVYGEEKNFIQPCLDNGGYRTWLKEPDGSYINHLGHDYNAPAGTEIKAIADGIVSEIRLDVEGFGSEDTKGPLVWIKHRLSNGKFFHALYGHIQPVKILKKGDSIKVGQIIGTIIEYLHKKTKKDISHLHFGIWNDENLPPRGTLLGYGPVNKFTNPIEFLQKNKPYKDERPPQDKGIPGGVVFTDGKQIIYYDFATREQTNLIVDLPGAGTFAVKTAAISEDGILLVFLDGANKFWARVLPQDKPYSIPVQEMFEHRNVQKSIRLTPLGHNIRNLRVSQRGREIAYESVKKDTALIEVPGDSETHLRRVSRRFPQFAIHFV